MKFINNFFLFYSISSFFCFIYTGSCMRKNLRQRDSASRERKRNTTWIRWIFSSFFLFFILFLQFSGNKLEENWMLLNDVQSDLTSVQSHLRKSWRAMKTTKAVRHSRWCLSSHWWLRRSMMSNSWCRVDSRCCSEFDCSRLSWKFYAW